MSRIALTLASMLVLLAPAPSRAVFHEALINEVMSGKGANPNVQFVEINQLAFTQNSVAGTRLTYFNCGGTACTILMQVPFNVPNTGPNVRWLMASPNDATFFAATGVHADFYWDNATFGNVDPTCGMVCWGAPGITVPAPNSWNPGDPNQYVDCVAYGGYTGPTKTSLHDGTPASGTPTSLTPGNGTQSLTRSTNTGNNSADFMLASPTPTNNGPPSVPTQATTATGPCTPLAVTTSTTVGPSTTTTTTVPLAGDDPGCVPDTKDHLKCGDTLGKAIAKAAAAVIKCHRKQAGERLNGVDSVTAGAAEDTCSESGGGKSAKEKLDAAYAKVQSHCSTSQQNAFTAYEPILFGDKSNPNSLDALNGSVYCAGTTDIDPTGDDAGKVPPDADQLACADVVGAELGKLIGRAIKCHAKLADTRFANKPFDEEACEDVDPVKHKAAREKYGAAMDKLDTKGVCTQTCLSRPNRDALGSQMVSVTDALTAVTYPCP